jgi:hypothetical protein
VSAVLQLAGMHQAGLLHLHGAECFFR